jgi:antitoxin component YwqK of YwqJK toxin-antitoxin module
MFNFSLAWCQKIEQDTIEGTAYYVYPFDNELTVHSNYYIAVKRAKGERYSYKQYYIEMFGEDFNKKEFKKSRRKAYRQAIANRKYRQKNRYFNSKFKKAVRKNPFPLLEQRYSLESDVIPCLDNIPDGKYVQYFSGYYPIGKNGRMTFEEKRVSGYFTIKNNMLDGEAIWFNAKGDTLKKGSFDKGLKVGTWFVENRRPSYSLSKIDVKLYIERGYPDLDTLTEFVNYSGGFKNGHYEMYQNSQNPVMEGSYTDNEPSGQWIEREIGYVGKGKNRKRNRNNTVETWTYTPASTDTAVHRPIIRKNLIKDPSFNSKFDFAPKFEPKISFAKMYSINYPKELDIELDEETITSYEGAEYENEYYGEEDYGYEDEYYGEEYYGDEYYEDDNGSFMNYVYDRNSGEYMALSKLIDSLGLVFNYDGVYEKRYPNGQVMIHYEFENGSLKEEDTIFWDNGKPYDVITFEADSNQYLHTIYDYNGKMYNQIVHDSKGAFVRVNFQPEKVKYVYLDGFKAEDRGYGKYYFYDKLDTLDFEIKDSLVLFRSWFKEDSSLMYSRSFDPNEQLLKFQMYAVTGKPVLDTELKFSENYESWTGTKNYSLGDITMKTTTSASFSEYVEKDSIPQRHINDFEGSFLTTEDYTLNVKNKPFTGNINVTLNEGKFSYNVGGDIVISFPKSYSMTKKLNKDLAKYKKTGKIKNEILFNSIDASEFDEDFGTSIFSYLLDGFIGEYVVLPYSEYDDYGMGGSESEKKKRPFSKKIIGYMSDGKPQGNWKIYDQFGKLQYEIPFEKGLIHGTIKEYDVVYPIEANDYYRPEIEFLKDSVPRKKTHYLFSTSEYKNGMLHGSYQQYNWLGKVNKQESYIDGLRDGSAFERNNLAYTILNYKEGGLDGYVQTYLTLKGQDSLLLFDLNFQNGLLQGESRSYHTNGELAKRGFFLNGDPIDDYEAYDTLGFKYHYVKFLYSFPVEEKIWEENELSVRYQFDWRDSIYFQPSDITTSQSLDRVLAQLGIGADYYNRPYYGRPSLVNKEGIDYHITKYYPNDTVARDGVISAGKKVGCWKYYSYEGQFLYEADYFDTIITLNDSIQFKAKGILTDYNDSGVKISDSYIIEKFEKYDCSHTDHYEIRQLMTIWQGIDSVDRMNGYVKNHYDNGVLQNEGWMKDGLPTGVWKFYDPFGMLNQVGVYVLGKRDGRWLGGDLSKTKYLGDICLNPNLPNLEEEIKYRENLLDIVITNYKMGKALNKEFYDVNMNNYEEESEEGEIIEEE